MASSGRSDDPVREAYWPRALAAADAARTRAQSGFTIASAIATGLIAAGLFANLADRSHWVRYVGGAALALWLTAMLLFLLAVVSGTGVAALAADQAERGFSVGLLKSVERERLRVERRLLAAVVVTSAAVLVTAATAVIDNVGFVDRDEGTLVLTAQGVDALHRDCGGPRWRTRHGSLDVPTLKSDFVLFRLQCGSYGKRAVRIPRDDVLAFVEKQNQ
jgi:hypothetical protein